MIGKRRLEGESMTRLSAVAIGSATGVSVRSHRHDPARLAPISVRALFRSRLAGEARKREWGLTMGTPMSLRRRAVLATLVVTLPLIGLAAYSTWQRYIETDGPAHNGPGFAVWLDIALLALAVIAAPCGAVLLAAWVLAPVRRVATRLGAEPDGADLATIDRAIQERDAVIEATKAELAQRTERLEGLHAIDRALLGAETVDAVARVATSRLRKVTGARAACVVSMNAERHRATILALDSVAPAPVGVGATFDFVSAPFGPRDLVDARAFKIDVDDVKTPALAALLQERGVRTCVAAPLVAQGELLGAVAMGFGVEVRVGDDVLAITTEVAAQLALAMRQTRLLADLEAVVDGAFDALLVLDQDGRLLTVNEVGCRLFDVSREELVGKAFSDIVPADSEGCLWDRFVADRTLDDVFTVKLAGRRRDVEIRGRADIGPGRHLFVIRDVSDRHRLEEQLRQAQKLEAIGRLAGGVAHDFNNLVTAIAGYSGLARKLIGSGPGVEELEGIDQAAQRAAQLTRQLLTFSRQQVVQPVLLDVAEVVHGMLPIVSRLIGEDVEVVVVENDERCLVRGDRTQIEQVILNLVVNARDAMPTGGILTIETRRAALDAAYAADHPGLVAGPYACLNITDTGMGMDAEVQDHIFEPFYTTKAAGHGTGLGLATVHGIVSQSGGHIHVYSEPGLGTTFKVYLPLVECVAPVVSAPDVSSPVCLRGHETVLLCEDDSLVRSLTERVLKRYGYHVLAASHPHEALELAALHDGIDIVVTDVVMPQLTGPELVERLHVLQPRLRALFLSGYPLEMVRDRASVPFGSAFLEKPFQAEQLVRSVRDLIEQTCTNRS